MMCVVFKFDGKNLLLSVAQSIVRSGLVLWVARWKARQNRFINRKAFRVNSHASL